MNNTYSLLSLDDVLDYVRRNDVKSDRCDMTFYCKSLLNYKEDNIRVLESGFFSRRINESTLISGNFFNNFAFIRLISAIDIDKLFTIEECIKNNLEWKLEQLNHYSYISKYPLVINQHLIDPTKDRSFGVYICDNVNSWGRTYNTLSEAKASIYMICKTSNDIKSGFDFGLKYESFVSIS